MVFCPVTGKHYNLSEEFPKIPFSRFKHIGNSKDGDRFDTLTQAQKKKLDNRGANGTRGVKSIRQTLNAATAFLDLSHLYGSTFEVATKIRGGQPGGRLKVG